jgi:hypothetical protein
MARLQSLSARAIVRLSADRPGGQPDGLDVGPVKR